MDTGGSSGSSSSSGGSSSGGGLAVPSHVQRLEQAVAQLSRELAESRSGGGGSTCGGKASRPASPAKASKLRRGGGLSVGGM